MFDLRPIFYVIGLLMVPLGISMLIPAAVDAVQDNPDQYVFLFSAAITLFFAFSFILANRDIREDLSLKQAFLLTTLSWLVLPAVGAIPLYLSEYNLSYTDAYFEAMSGLTTTGSTVISGLDTAPPGLLLWRALLQWLGGVGIIVMAVAILPMLKVGGMQLFRMESSDTSEKILPRAAQLSAGISWLYLVISLLCFIGLMVAGMGPFDAIIHAMTTISTGGFSTSDGSVGHFDNAMVDWVLILFMTIGSLPFVLMLQAVRGRPLAFWRDAQVRGNLFLLGFISLTISIWLYVHNEYDFANALRFGTFNIVSVMTGTGFASTDYSLWGNFPSTIFFMVMFIGGTAGSASCGVKTFRVLILLSSLRAQIKRISMPHGIFHTRFNGRPVSQEALNSVMSFFFLFVITYLVLVALVALTGVDFVTAASGVGTTISNVGPGLGETIGPASTFAELPDAAKWILSISMLLGRLELFTVLVLFSPRFWRQ